MNTADRWPDKDPAPGANLALVNPVSQRAHALLFRSRDKAILKTDYLTISGAIDMMDALDYHYGNYRKLRAEMRPVDDLQRRMLEGERHPELVEQFFVELRRLKSTYQAAIHEVVAYINRLGQFCAFTKSKLVKSRPVCPKTKVFLSVRNKVTAHRSIDDPRGESQDLREMHAWALSRHSAIGFGLSGGEVVNSYQVNVSEESVENICLEVDHPVVMQECYSVVEVLLV